MVIGEKHCKDEIDALTPQDWRPLLALIPKIEDTSTFGEWSGGTADAEGVIQFPYCVPVPIVSQFLELVYAIPVIISFDWVSWDEGRKIVNDDNYDLDSIDLLTKCKLITAIVRNDRFREGALVSAFESGLILKILKSIEKVVSTKVMSSGKPLKMVVCMKCEAKFFVEDPTPGPYGAEMLIHDAAPSNAENRQVVVVKCSECQHQQFAEFRYGPMTP